MELWRYDGNQVEIVADVNPGEADSYPRDFAVVGDSLYFKSTSTSGQEVWKFDGEQASILDDTNPGPESSDPRHLSSVNGELLFSAVQNRVRRVFVSDGETTEPIVNGGGPIQVGNDFYTIRGRRERGVEINDLHHLDGSFYRSTVPSAGPFVTFNDSLFFSCSCSDRELYMIADAGDTDSDGAVTFVDFLSLAKNYGGDGGWKNGDSNGDGQVEFDDFLAQAENFGGAPIKKSQTTSVPEPSASILFAVGLIGCLARMRKRKQV